MEPTLFKNNVVAIPVIGREVICPDGLGRIMEVIRHGSGSTQIRVDTYIRNRSCLWASTNVEYLDIPGRRTLGY